MGNAFLKSVLTTQPQASGQRIDWSNPLTRGLVAIVSPFAEWQTTPSFINTPIGKAIGPHASIVGFLKTPGNIPVIESVGNSTIFSYEYHKGNPEYNNTDEYYRDSGSDWPNDLGLKLISPTTYGHMQLEARATDGTRYQARKKVIAASSLTTPCTIKRTGTLDSSYLMTAYGGASTEGGDSVAKNWGTDTGMQGYTYNPSTKSYASPRIQLATGYDSNASLILMLRWNRVLQYSEIQLIHQNPWRIFYTQNRVITTSAAQLIAPKVDYLMRRFRQI